MQGKLYAGNPHVRFDEGAGAPRHSGRSALLYKRSILDAVALMAAMATFAAGPVSWDMEVEIEGAKEPLSVESVQQKCRAEGGRFEYGPLTCDGRTLDMKVVVNVRDTPNGKVYSGVVENNDSRARVTMFNGPRLGAVALDPARAHIYIPSGFGRRLNYFPLDGKKSGPWDAGTDSFLCTETKLYPSPYFTMPWIAVDTGGGTWYAAVHDVRERAKRVGVRWYHREKNADVRFRHPVSIRAGDRWELPETVFEKVGGDWHAAAKRYRAWFDTTHPAVRSAAPDWTRDLTGWLLVIMKQQNEELMWPYTDIPRLCDVAERNGLNSIGLFGWTVGGHDHLYPDYDADPKMGGAEALKAGIAEAHRRGIRVCIYANGQLQQVGATKFWGEHGEKIAIRRRDGSPYVQTYHKYKDIPVYQFALGCLYCEPWHDRMLALARQAQRLGADAFEFDQLGAMEPYECWGEGHGHPVPHYSHCEERAGFIRRIADEMHANDKDFAIVTEGLYDAHLATIGMFHAWTPSAFMKDVNALKVSRATSCAKSEPFPEIFRYTFPELVTTTRNPTPMMRRSFVNYGAVFGLRHEIEIRYMPDRTYVLDGKVPTKADYGEVKNLPSLEAMHAEPPVVASAYMRAVCDFQRAHAKYLLRGTFVDDEGIAVTSRAGSPLPAASGLVAKRFVADDGTSAVCVWNLSDKPADVVINGLGQPQGVFAPGNESVAGPLAPDSIRLYVFQATCGTSVAKPDYATFICHRGESEDAPENTLPAYKMAVDRGFGFECDIYLSADKRVFTFHDRNLKRTTAGACTKKCAEANWDTEISKADVGGWGKWKGSRFAGTRPALLEEVLELARDGRQIYVEVKTGPEIVPYIKKVFAKQKNATPKNVRFITFKRKTCRKLKKLMPEYKVYWLAWAKVGPKGAKKPVTAEYLIDGIKATRADGVDCQFDSEIVTADLVKKVKDAGYEFHVWTVDKLDESLKAFARGVQTVTTNCAKKQLDEYKARRSWKRTVSPSTDGSN